VRKPQSPPQLSELVEKTDRDHLVSILMDESLVDEGKYLHWDELRRRTAPEGITHEEWWFKIKTSRLQLKRELPLKDCQGEPFHYCLADLLLESLPKIDAQARGNIGISEQVMNSEHRDRYVISSLIEEAITSSQLEGAVTTRKDAVDMLRSGRKPIDKSEQMILNNFHAMEEILSIYKDDLTPEKICELHRIVTHNTLDNPEMAGQLQSPNDERVKVWDDAAGEVLHYPPAAEELSNRMQEMCDFANESLKTEKYLHPIIRAVTLHFWLAYDHPFEDGNGRTARAIFYWAMLRQGYWLFEFISISSLLKKAPTPYARSYLFTETDDNDLTYFIIHQLNTILKSISALEEYVDRKSKEIRNIDAYLHDIDSINHRQKALLSHALKHPASVYSIGSHGRSHNIAYATSRADLLKLDEMGLLRTSKTGKALRFRIVDNLNEMLISMKADTGI